MAGNECQNLSQGRVHVASSPHEEPLRGQPQRPGEEVVGRGGQTYPVHIKKSQLNTHGLKRFGTFLYSVALTESVEDVHAMIRDGHRIARETLAYGIGGSLLDMAQSVCEDMDDVDKAIALIDERAAKAFT